MTIKIAVANQKGGVGKTTTTINLGAELEERGRTVMLVDLDPQASLTVSKGVKADLSMADVLGNHQPGTAKLSQVVRQVSARQWLAPADIALATAEQGMMQRIGREVLLKAALTPVKANYVLIDCPPSLGLLTVNALVAADWVLIPVQAEYLALRGLALFWQTMQQVETLNPALRLAGIVPTMVRHTQHHSRIVETMKANIEARVFDEVPMAIAVSEAHAAGKPVRALARDSAVSEAYKVLALEVERVCQR